MKKEFNQIPTPEEITPIVRKALRRCSRRDLVVTRRNLIFEIFNNCRCSREVITKIHKNGDLSFLHMMDLALLDMKKERKIYSIDRGKYYYKGIRLGGLVIL